VIFPIVCALTKLFLASKYKIFINSFSNPREEQKKTLQKILKLIPGLESGITIEQFQKTVPLQRYSEYLSSPYKVKPESILFHETTSGSTSGKKAIPYTKELLSSFSEMFSIWVYDILKHGPQFKTGKLYFSITPQFSAKEEASSNHAALKDDSDYIVGPLKYLFNYLSICPSNLKNLQQPDNFFHILSLYLIREIRLEIISIWSPTFLIEIFRYIGLNKDAILRDLEANKVIREGITFKLPKISSSQLKILKESNLSPDKLMPNLKFISCWGGAHAQTALKKLAKLCPQAHIQEKGLLATEAPLTLPLFQEQKQVPLIREVFFEFRDSSNTKATKLLHELQQGHEYEVIISQAGGMLRYLLSDRVQVDGKMGSTPTFRFIRRANETSDLVGEKLTGLFVSSIFNRLDESELLLLPVKPEEMRPYYLLLSPTDVDPETVEEELMNNPHYRNAIKLNQLGSLKTLTVPNLTRVIADYKAKTYGQSLGDQKSETLLIRETNGNLYEFLNNRD
jgi:hypothetical protein